MTMTEHFQKERAARYAYIATTVGVGKVIHEHKQTYNKWGTEPCVVAVTDTGVVIVKSPEGAIVTMYIVSIQEARKYFVGAAMPFVLEAIIKTNMKKGYVYRQNEGVVQTTPFWLRAGAFPRVSALDRAAPNLCKLHKTRKNKQKSLCILTKKIFPKPIDKALKVCYNKV